MSFLSGIVNLVSGKSAWSGIVKTVVLGWAVSRLSPNNKANDPTGADANIDRGVRLQVPPSADKKVPVLYGAAHFGGIITDAAMSNSNKTMAYCITLSERTGNLLSTGQPSTYTFKNIYWNDQRIVFKSDGITADYTVDREGSVDRSISGIVKVYCYAGNSNLGKTPENYTGTVPAAYTVMTGWTSAMMMNDLIFAIVKVDYNREKNVTGIANMTFHIENSMTLPGDCLNDYMLNTRYGAGIPAAEIYSA